MLKPCLVALVLASAACGPSGATSASAGGGAALSPECEWTKEYDKLPPGAVAPAVALAAADAGTD